MSTGYHWMNFDRREQLSVTPFDTNIEIWSTCFVGNEYTEAVVSLLAGEWAGDSNAYIPDSFMSRDIEDAGSPPFLVRAAEEFGTDVFDEAEDAFACVEGRFREMDGRMERTYPDDDWPLYIDSPYEGPFDLEFTHPRYLVNRTKREYVDRESTMVWFIRRGPQPFEVLRFDPTPLLLCTKGAMDDHWDHGPWLGDYVYASALHPGEDYRDATRDYVYNEGPLKPVYATDDQIKAVMERRTNDYGDLTEEEIEDIKACLRWW